MHKASTNKNNIEYNPQEIEPKWQAVWSKEKIYQPDLKTAKKPYYNLHMFPYPSAEGLHVGNVYAFTGADIHGRFKRMQGYSVFQPFGLDGFGIHSENYALKVGSHPMDQAQKSEKRFYKQVESLGSGYDWSRTLETYDPDYYRWTQWIFIELFKAGLAYRDKVPVNFCPSCKTVLADEQVEGGKCERCGSEVEKRHLEQWMFRITEYAEELLSGLDKIDWTEKVRIAQKNWIGKSEGARIAFRVEGTETDISVFTTRPDTLYGATFLVVSPEHPFVASLPRRAKSTPRVLASLKRRREHPKGTSFSEAAQRAIKEYVEAAASKRDQDRVAEGKEKSGIFSGAYVVNPINNQQIPIWIADYVLMSYGTGAIMAVPAHDQRDYEFARKYQLPIVQVVEGEGADIAKEAYVGNGKLINSGDWNGVEVAKDKAKTIASLEQKGIGSKFTTYHLRDWLISRQRYWGPPIPMIYCESCASNNKSWFDTEKAKGIKRLFSHFDNTRDLVAGWYPEEKLPVALPSIEDYKPLGIHSAGSLQSGGQAGQANSPLGNHPEFYETTCPACGSKARRETDVSDTFLDSAWYFYRYISPQDSKHPWDPSLQAKWLPPTLYTGGAEHSVLHLLYARFLAKVFKDLGLISFDEPFPRFFAHGLIIKDGSKMSKSKGNVVNPDDYITKYGADTLRSYLMFLGRFSMGGDFKDSGLEGMSRFIKRVWTLATGKTIISKDLDASAKSEMHKTIKGVSDDLEALRYNTAIAKIMTYYNYLSGKTDVAKEEIVTLLKLLAPFAPHMTEELYQRLSFSASSSFESIHTSSWPEFDPGAVRQLADVVIAIQVNGKLRGTLRLRSGQAVTEEEVRSLAKKDANVSKQLEGKAVRKVVFVPGKILNFVIS